jgi:superfamily II DNA or RNA helicase
MQLRDYQLEAVEQIEEHIAVGSNELCLNAPPGYGKSVVIAELFKRALENNKSIGVIINVSALIPQLIETIKEHCSIEPTVVKAGMEQETDAKAYIIMEQTVYSRGWQFGSLDYLLIDEYHLSYDTKRKNKVREDINPKVIIGLSGTPWDSKGNFIPNKDNMITTKTTLELVEDNHLSNVEFFKASGYREISDKVDNIIARKKYITDDDSYNIIKGSQDAIIDNILSQFEDIKAKKSVWFCSSIKHAEQVADILKKKIGNTIKRAKVDATLFGSEINSEEINSVEVIHSKRKESENEDIIKKFRVGEIMHLVSISKVSVGFDVPDIIYGVDLKPSNSDRDYIQRIGRIRRTHENKPKGIWIDCVGNLDRLGLDTWEHIEPNDDFKKKQARDLALSLLKNIKDNVEVQKQLEVEFIEYRELQNKTLKELELKQLLTKYDIESDLEEVLKIGSEIYRRLYGKNKLSDRLEKWFSGKVVNYWIILKEWNRDFLANMYAKMIKTRFKNIIKQEKKPAGLYFFVSFIFTQSTFADRFIEEFKAINKESNEVFGWELMCYECSKCLDNYVFEKLPEILAYDTENGKECYCGNKITLEKCKDKEEEEEENYVDYEIDLDENIPF